VTNHNATIHAIGERLAVRLTLDNGPEYVRHVGEGVLEAGPTGRTREGASYGEVRAVVREDDTVQDRYVVDVAVVWYSAAGVPFSADDVAEDLDVRDRFAVADALDLAVRGAA
jgi:hypothetical protein